VNEGKADHAIASESDFSGCVALARGIKTMPEFSTILRSVVGLVALSATFAVLIALVNAFVAMPFAGDLIHAFIESFKAGLAGLVGLLAGSTAAKRQERRRA
jgi:hypothetical protein